VSGETADQEPYDLAELLYSSDLSAKPRRAVCDAIVSNVIEGDTRRHHDDANNPIDTACLEPRLAVNRMSDVKLDAGESWQVHTVTTTSLIVGGCRAVWLSVFEGGSSGVL
jgi:hypothetical protein